SVFGSTLDLYDDADPSPISDASSTVSSSTSSSRRQLLKRTAVDHFNHYYHNTPRAEPPRYDSLGLGSTGHYDSFTLGPYAGTSDHAISEQSRHMPHAY